jgi:hypothetical protein
LKEHITMRCLGRAIAGCCLALSLWSPADGAELTTEAVLDSIDRGRKYLVNQQMPAGGWLAQTNYTVGANSLVTLALVNSGMTIEDEPVLRAITNLRAVADSSVAPAGVAQGSPLATYDISLLIMALAAVKDGRRDATRIQLLANELESFQIDMGNAEGMWGYTVQKFHPDRSNSQFAILALYEAAQAGAVVDRATWERAKRNWIRGQQGDGGWGYSSDQDAFGPTGSMTVAGISSMAIITQMLHDEEDLNPDGTPKCCAPSETDDAEERGVQWLAQRFSVGRNPGAAQNAPGRQEWLLYYLYGMERAGRLSGRRFFGEHDWYREGAQFLIDGQSQRTGEWKGESLENDPIIASSLALLFLSKGLAPVLISKLQYGEADPFNPGKLASDEWNLHPRDVRNLTQHISGLPKWPSLVTSNVVQLAKVAKQGSVADLMQAPILLIAGGREPAFTDAEVALLVEYVNQGGFILGVANCADSKFGEGFKALVARMYPAGEAELRLLPADHPVYRAEYLLDPANVELWGADFGCRTAIMYSPDDISCLWDKWARHDPPRRTPEAKAMIGRGIQVGVNIAAYVTGREPPKSLDEAPIAPSDEPKDQVERGFLQIAKLRHAGTWDAAPHALHNLLLALNKIGLAASMKQTNLPATDANLFNYPLVYMHGRTSFRLNAQEREQLKLYLERGGVLFVDACCGAEAFDRSFRELMADTFPEKPLARIPADHELFTDKVGSDIREVRRRAPGTANPNAALDSKVQVGEPFLEGVTIDDRLAVIYSKYDISCALERQSSVACAGYVEEDAVKIAANVVLYSLLQDARYGEAMK